MAKKQRSIDLEKSNTKVEKSSNAKVENSNSVKVVINRGR